MTISEFEKSSSELRYELVKRYRLENGKRIVNFLVKQEADQFYLWLKGVKSESQVISPAL
jgi:hypothetical protein